MNAEANIQPAKVKIGRVRSLFTNWREWEGNPIVIKELRQGVRSWTVSGMLLLFLVVMFVATVAFLIGESIDGQVNPGLGSTVVSVFMVILAGASVLFIPLYTGIRVSAERQENNADLLYVTTLSPARIILGKFLCSAYIALLFFSACMPFMAFTNLLRGVDLPTIFFILAFLYLFVCVANMVAVFMACVPASRPFKVLFALVGFIFSIYIIAVLSSDSFLMVHSGLGSMIAGSDFWFELITVAFCGMALIGLFFVCSVALISPPSSNRALPVKIYITGLWLLSGLISFVWVARTGNLGTLATWAYWTLVFMAMALLVAISNSDQLSVRVRRTIPKSSLARMVAFLFYNGAAGGLFWIAGIMALTYLAMLAAQSSWPAGGVLTSNIEAAYLTLTVYAFDYALTALFIQREFLSRRPPKLAGLLAVLLAGGWALAPSFFLFFANRLTWQTEEGLQLGNIFNVFFYREQYQLTYHELFACGWFLVAVALNGRWFLRQLMRFVPFEKPSQPPLIEKEG